MVAALAACASAKQDAAPTPVHEVVTGGARIRGGSVRMDVQVGRPFTQTPMRNAAAIAKPHAVVTP